MNKIQKWVLVIAALIFSLGTLFHGCNGRYTWQPGQDLGKEGGYYLPRTFDSWTGNWKSH